MLDPEFGVSFESFVIMDRKENKGVTYIDAVVMEGLTGVEFVRRVVLISGQELTPKFAVNIRRCRQIEGETRHSVDAGDGAVDERGNESRSNFADIEIVKLVVKKVGVGYSRSGISFKSFGVVDLLCGRRDQREK